MACRPYYINLTKYIHTNEPTVTDTNISISNITSRNSKNRLRVKYGSRQGEQRQFHARMPRPFHSLTSSGSAPSIAPLRINVTRCLHANEALIFETTRPSRTHKYWHPPPQISTSTSTPLHPNINLHYQSSPPTTLQLPSSCLVSQLSSRRSAIARRIHRTRLVHTNLAANNSHTAPPRRTITQKHDYHPSTPWTRSRSFKTLLVSLLDRITSIHP